MLGVSIADVFLALQTLVGSVYVNNFNKFGRVYQVIVQASPLFAKNLAISATCMFVPRSGRDGAAEIANFDSI